MANDEPIFNPDTQSQPPLAGATGWYLATERRSGETAGTVTYEWREGGFFLLQHFDFTLHGHPVRSLEVIGHLQPFGAAPSPEIRSRAYDSVGNTLDYVYELNGDTLMIWGGEKGSPAYFKGIFSADGSTLAGAWVYPGGGGYESTAVRGEAP